VLHPHVAGLVFDFHRLRLGPFEGPAIVKPPALPVDTYWRKKMLASDGSNLLFIAGCPRSGTTWLHRLVASHELCATGQETNLFDEYLGRFILAWKLEPTHFDGRGPHGLRCYLTEHEFWVQLRKFVISLFGDIQIAEGGYFIEKTPTNICHVDKILELFPQAKVVIIHRHPFQVVPSLLSASKSWGKNWAPSNMVRAIKMWRRYARCTLEALSFTSSGRVIVIPFDRLRMGTADELKLIFDFMKLQYSEEKIQNIVEDNRAGGPRMLKIPLYGEYNGGVLEEPEGFHREQKSDRKLSFFAKLLIYFIAHKEMRALGYTFSR
jgi:hypothetical protein